MELFLLILSSLCLLGLVFLFFYFIIMWNNNMKKINQFSKLMNDRMEVLEQKIKPYESLE